MKNTISVTMDSDKLSALTMYMAQKNLNVEDELAKYAEQLYQKNVPQNVRDFIDMTAKRSCQAKSKRKTGYKTDENIAVPDQRLTMGSNTEILKNMSF